MARQPVVRHNDWGSLTPADPRWVGADAVGDGRRPDVQLPAHAALRPRRRSPHSPTPRTCSRCSSSTTRARRRRSCPRCAPTTPGWSASRRAGAAPTRATSARSPPTATSCTGRRRHARLPRGGRGARRAGTTSSTTPSRGGDKRFVDPASLLEVDPAVVRDRVAARRGGRPVPGPGARAPPVGRGLLGQDRRPAHRRAARPALPHRHDRLGDARRSTSTPAASTAPCASARTCTSATRSPRPAACFVVDREARSWHLGRSQVLRRAEQVNRYNDPYLADLVPTMRPKRNRRGRRLPGALPRGRPRRPGPPTRRSTSSTPCSTATSPTSG